MSGDCDEISFLAPRELGDLFRDVLSDHDVARHREAAPTQLGRQREQIGLRGSDVLLPPGEKRILNLLL